MGSATPLRRPRTGWIAAALALLAACPAGQGRGAETVGDPTRRITLRLDNVSPEEAVAALARTSGLPVQLQIDPRQIDWLPQSRATFNWQALTFSAALRQICDRFRLEPNQRAANNYLLTGPDVWGRQLTPEPVDDAAVFQQQGLRLFIHQLRSRQQALTVELACEAADGDTTRIAGIDNLLLVDDQGNVAAPFADRISGSRLNARTPDIWLGSCGNLANCDPNASQLASVQGDLMIYRKVLPVRLEVPIRGVPGAPPAARSEEGIRVEVQRFEAGPSPAQIARAQAAGKLDPRQRLEGDLVANRGPADLGPALRARIILPPDAPCAPADPKKMDWAAVRHPVLTGASGRPYGPFVVAAHARREGENTVVELTCGWSGIREPVARAGFELVERSEPARLFSFEMRDIPIPRRWGRMGGGGGDRALEEPRHPFYLERGGSLASRVQVGDRPAAGGSLRLGLALREAEGWGPVRWIQVPVDSSGQSRLFNLKPGTYRVLRRYESKSPLPGGGAWQNGETQATVTAGKPAVLPPLRWAGARAAGS